MSFELTYDAIAKRIDHSLLGPALSTAELEDGCRLAIALRCGQRLHQADGGGAGIPDYSRAQAWLWGRPSGFRTAGTRRR